MADVRRAVQYVRAHATEFGTDPSRLGIVGFGAGAALAAETIYTRASAGDAASPDPVSRLSSRPDFMALIDGSAPLPADAAAPPPTFLVASTRGGDGQSGAVDLWARLRAVRTPVDAHFFARADASIGLAATDPAVGAWPQSFVAWMRYRGYLTNQPRVPVRGMAWLDGRPLPHGYVVLTPIGFVGAGPIVCRVMNSTAGIPIGQFTVPVSQGPTPGRYRVAVYQNARRWLSNSFTAPQTRDPAFGHARILSPSLEDQRVYTKVRPGDPTDYTIEIRAGGDENLRIEVFSGAPVDVAPPRIAGLPSDGSANPGIAAYLEQLAHTPNPVPGVPDPILLWPNGAPGAVPDAQGVFTDEDKPALYAYPAPPDRNSGAAVLVLPGGAFTNRAIDQEGVQMAQWFRRQGVSAFVLRYRIRPNYNGQVSTLDAHRAMRHIRAHAARYGVAADRIGVIGSSAGAELVGDAFFNAPAAADPAAADPIDRLSAASNFNVLIYGGRTPRDPSTAAPTFMFVTLEDGGNHLAPQIAVLNGLRAAGIPVQAHWYQDGPHGTSMSPGDPQLGQWPDLLARFLVGQGIVRRQLQPD
jgi:acetyl esterase/lipase